MKIWLQSNGEILFKVEIGYVRIFSRHTIYLYLNKRAKLKEVDIIAYASAISEDYPTNFTSMYYTEDIKYWHELRGLIKAVCV